MAQQASWTRPSGAGKEIGGVLRGAEEILATYFFALRFVMDGKIISLVEETVVYSKTSG